MHLNCPLGCPEYGSRYLPFLYGAGCWEIMAAAMSAVRDDRWLWRLLRDPGRRSMLPWAVVAPRGGWCRMHGSGEGQSWPGQLLHSRTAPLGGYQLVWEHDSETVYLVSACRQRSRFNCVRSPRRAFSLQRGHASLARSVQRPRSLVCVSKIRAAQSANRIQDDLDYRERLKRCRARLGGRDAGCARAHLTGPSPRCHQRRPRPRRRRSSWRSGGGGSG